MLRPVKKSARICTDYVVTDIENRSDGTVLAIDLYDGNQHNLFHNWDEWIAFVFANAVKYKKMRTIYAHNGGRWDWLSLIEHILKDRPDIVFNTVENGSMLICVTIPITDKISVKLVDSLFMLKSSLDDAATKMIGRGKMKLEHLPEWYYDNDRAKFWQYLREDTETLYKTMIAFGNIVYSKIAPISKLGVTLPSCALRCFQTNYLDCEIMTHENDDEKRIMRSGYAGGRVEVFQPGYYRDIWVYDINSLYPSVMLDTPVPITGTWTKNTKGRFDKAGMYRIRFEQTRKDRPALFMVDGIGRYKGEGWFFTNEIRRFDDAKLGKLKILSGYTWANEGVIFKDFVTTLYSLRMTDKDGPIGGVCKLLMNSLYGKFGQKPERSFTCRKTASEIFDLTKKGVRSSIVSAELGIYKIMEEKPAHYEHVGIAGTITSEARARLWEKMDGNTVYCDTDSIHQTRPISNTSTNLGDFKLEFQGEGVYCGKKLYALRKSGTEKLRVKGVRLGGDLGERLDFNSLVQMLGSGYKIACTFGSSATLAGITKGKKSCTFEKKVRRIGPTWETKTKQEV